MSWRKPTKKQLHVYCDGACSGNPGPATFAFIITYGDGQIVEQSARFIGHSTNVAAEYEAILQALYTIVSSQYYANEIVHIYSDNENVVKQLRGEYRTHAEHLKSKRNFCKEMEKELKKVIYHHMTDAHPMIKKADRLAKKVMRVDY